MKMKAADSLAPLVRAIRTKLHGFKSYRVVILMVCIYSSAVFHPSTDRIFPATVVTTERGVCCDLSSVTFRSVSVASCKFPITKLIPSSG